MPLIPVEGTITRGGRPVRARMTLDRIVPAGEDKLAGERRIVLYSSPQGIFDGALPAAGRGWVKAAFGADAPEQLLGPVAIERRRSGPAPVSLIFAETRVCGRVVDARDDGVRSARVEVSPLPVGDSGRHVRGRPGREHGRFEFEGLAQGRYRGARFDVDRQR